MKALRSLIIRRFLPLALAGLASVSAAPASRPNIVFIYADDLGWGDIASHGHPKVVTPHLDRLSREGTDFWGFHVVNPVCSPSRTGILTGQFPARWGVHNFFYTHEQNVARGMPDWLDPKAPLLPRQLHDAGYRTAHYGKWHLSGPPAPDLVAPLPARYGYDDAAVWVGPGRDVFEGTSLAGTAPKDGPLFHSIAATEQAVKFIRESKGAPFYVNLWLHETHYLVAATEDEKRLYADVPEPQRTYYAAVTRADRQVGRILAVLDELGLAKDTIVIFSSDNGPENSHAQPDQKFYFSQGSTGGLRGRKRSLLMGGVNTPFLVRWPGVVPAGRVDKETVLAAVDVFPTLLAAAGVAAPAGYVSDGENMLSAFQGRPTVRSKPIFWEWRGGHNGDDWPAFAMRDGPWVLTLDETRQRAELCNLVTDRGQTRNLASEQPERLARMKAEIARWAATLPAAPARPVAAKLGPVATGDGLTAARAIAFERWDKNRDGRLTLEEYRDGLAKKDDAESRFRNFDRNRDGVLTRDEFAPGATVAPPTAGAPDLEALNRAHMAKVYFNRLDPNRDGVLTAEEFKGDKQAGREKQLQAFAPGLRRGADVRWDEFLRRFTAPEVKWPGESRRNLVYKHAEGKPLLLDVYLPLRRRFDRAPVLYFIHGGGWEDGLKEFLLTEKIKATLAQRLGEEGFCLVSVSYRLVDARSPAPRDLVRDCVVDVKDGLRYLGLNATDLNIDPDNIFVWGESAGAHLAMMLAFSGPAEFAGDPALAASLTRPAAAISWFGPTDFTAAFERDFRGPGSNRFAHRIAGPGRSPTDVTARLREVNPWDAIRPDSPPLLLMQGDTDTAVSADHAKHLKVKADQIGAQVELVMVRNAGHNWRAAGADPIEPSTEEITEHMKRFALRHLRR
ncbi:MAG: sulfatase-like hydrolase/transferase [Opitutaceae bacterium]|nr:sulfatase-like hydrolase/transferase [Opitutaceae bacterium]